MSHLSWDESEGEWLKRNRRRWLYTPEGVTELSKWFKNSCVRECIKDERHMKMLDEFLQKSDRRYEVLLRPAAKRLALHLLIEDIFTSREERTAGYFLHGYVKRVWSMAV
jgi:predicted glycoside hydrolase/deacetylase ChbG (UPF0249 family)